MSAPGIATEHGFYVTGGTLRRDAPSYVEREADRTLYEDLLQGKFCYVLTSRQMGKSSLMVRTAARLREVGVGVAVLDLTAIGQNLTAEQWYDGLLGRIGSQLQLEDEIEEFWLNHPRLGPLQRWMSAITEVVLPRYPGRLVIFVDEIDAVRSLAFSTDEFFAGIREFYNRRTEEPELERLTFCLLGAAAPSDLIRDTRTTPFNIGQRIELNDFTEAEAAPLAQGLQKTPEAGARMIERALYWTGGHPYLTQRLCQSVAEEARADTPAEVDRLCQELFLSHYAQERDDNLMFVRERMLRGEFDLAGLLSLYAQVRRGKRVLDDVTNPLISILRLSGITKTRDGFLGVRNRIYERVFDQPWVEENMPDAELRRQRAAYRRGLLRATAVAVVILAVIVSLTVITFQQRNRAEQHRARAEQQEQSNRRLLYVAHMNLAQRDLERWNTRRLPELLEVHIPHAGQEDLRGFEWYYFWRICHIGSLTLRNGGLLGSEASSPDSKISAARSEDSDLKLWDAATGLTILKGHRGKIESVNFSSDNNTLITSTIGGELMLWNLTSGQELAAPKWYGNWGSSDKWGSNVVFSPDGKRLATRRRIFNLSKLNIEGAIKLWDAVTGQELSVINVFSNYVTFSPDGKILSSGSEDGSVKLWDVATGQELITLKGHEGRLSHVAFSPDGKRLATSHTKINERRHEPPSASAVIVWDVATGRELITIKVNTSIAEPLAFSLNGKTLAIRSSYTSVKLLDVATGQELATIRGHEGSITSVVFSPDGKRLATGSSDCTVRLWYVVTSQELLTLSGRAVNINSVAFSPDGRTLASGSDDGSVRMWRAATHQEVLARSKQ